MNDRQRRQTEQLRADQRTLRVAIDHLWAAPGSTRLAALSAPHVASCCAEILEVLADELAAVPAPVRDHAVRVCRELVGDPMDMPARRRTRRR